MAYAWSQNGITYIISTCGKTVRNKTNYISHFEDEFGHPTYKQLPRAAIVHILCSFLPLIDEHDKDRQSALALQLKWKTQNCWFRFLSTLTGQCVIDLLRWDHCMQSETKIRIQDEREDFDVTEMVNLLSRMLRDGGLGAEDKRRPRLTISQLTGRIGPLTCIQGSDGLLSYGKCGKNQTITCFICCKYVNKHINTTWKCKVCSMPLCKRDRGQGTKCVKEH